ncbi:MAG: DUF342 domain-containing protein [candidate division Zixibacteria bacterium]|nr:DUF342 domain-containing protein [candidate division Zixibacteria bacterium]
MSAGAQSTGTRERIKVIVSKDAMSASLLLRKPATDEQVITEQEVLDALAREGVMYGINSAAITSIISDQRFNVPVKVADGVPPEKGQNATFTYHFNTTDQHQPRVDANGNIDYKDINFIQNCTAGQVLVTKTPPSVGKPGMDVTGKEIGGPIGRDLSFNNGANTEVTGDGRSVVTTASGVIQFTNGKVSVVDVVSINGDVDFNVGNIDCRGSVRVKGDIKAGFELTIDGDLEVSGNVEDARLIVKGNIFVKGGFFGDGQGIMDAGGDIILRYAEGQKINCGGSVTVGGEIIKCLVTAKERVTVKGRRGKIVGGEIRAGKDIRAAILGSPAGTATILVAGYNADVFAAYFRTIQEIARVNQDADRVKGALATLMRLDAFNKLTPGKREVMAKLELFLDEVPESLAHLEQVKQEAEAKLKELSDARIHADEIIYPGVRTTFGLVYKDFNQEEGRGTYLLDGNQVRRQ